MSKKILTNSSAKINVAGYKYIQTVAGVEEYELKNNKLRVLFMQRPDTGVITTNITYKVGARDEICGETGLAHMLEHMLFKPTASDVAKKIVGGSAMQFERSTGSVLNANTWKDRTTYYFCYPKKYFAEALRIEAERMTGTILTDKALKPEQNNVLSEFDMYNGDPHFALNVQMVGVTFHSHPYGHETIGYREDIEDYTAEKLEKFYRNYYRPDNAVLMIIGDIDRKTALSEAKKLFEGIENPKTPIPRLAIREPKQEGLRRVCIERPSTTNIVSIGFKHAGFPTDDWFITSIMLDVLTGGEESVLYKLLVDTGKSSSVEAAIEPASYTNLASINITLAPNEKHEVIEELVLAEIAKLTPEIITPLIKKTKAKSLTDELFLRTKSQNIAQELTEYVSSGKWERYGETAQILQSITVKQISHCLQTSFIRNNMTIGHFIGKI